MSATENFVKHADIWFEDGNIVLISEQSGFRVHKGLLARHSEVFRDMFLMPQPPPTEEGSYEGCPTVRLVGDSAKEVAMILLILYDGGRRFYNEAVSLDRQIAIAALRVGTKYGFNDIRQEALRRISVCYPKNLKDLQNHGLYCRSDCPVNWNADDVSASSVAIFSLARQLGLNDPLPAALYRCCATVCSSRVLLSGVGAVSDNDFRAFVLTPQELLDCLETREELHEQNVKIYEALARLAHNPQCRYREQGQNSPCMKAMKEFIFDSLLSMDLRSYHALCTMEPLIQDLVDGASTDRSLCTSCASVANAAVFAEQDEIWAGLRKKCCPTNDPPMDAEN